MSTIGYMLEKGSQESRRSAYDILMSSCVEASKVTYPKYAASSDMPIMLANGRALIKVNLLCSELQGLQDDKEVQIEKEVRFYFTPKRKVLNRVVVKTSYYEYGDLKNYKVFLDSCVEELLCRYGDLDILKHALIKAMAVMRSD